MTSCVQPLRNEQWLWGELSERNRFFFLLSMYDIVCDFSRNLSYCQFSAIFFFSSSFYSRYHIEIRTYFYIIYMHNRFHNRGGVFHFQIIRDRIVIAWFFLKFYTFCKVLSSSFSFFFFIKVYFNTCDNIYFELASSYNNCSK